MFATAPVANSQQATPLYASPTAKSAQDSASSTRASSPVSSSSSSDDADITLDSVQPRVNKIGANGGLARRRGCNVLMLNELVLDLEIQPCKGSPGFSQTACPPQAMSFSAPNTVIGSGIAGTVPQAVFSTGAPPNNTTPQCCTTADAGMNPVTEHSIMRTSPTKTSMDASQRIPACTSRLGAAAAGGDASQRNPLGRVSLGVAVIGGDASQRSPPGRNNLMQAGAFPAQQTLLQRTTTDQGLSINTTDAAYWSVTNNSGQGITGTQPVSSPASSCSSSTQPDASQRSPGKNSPTNSAVEASNETLKSWLCGASVGGMQISNIDLAEQLRAAAPESYED